jgi:hypothetical protein
MRMRRRDWLAGDDDTALNGLLRAERKWQSENDSG